MNVISTKVETNVVELKVEVSANRVDEAITKAYKKVAREITLPGFRKGKAPRRLLEARFGVEVFYDDAVDILLNEVYPEAVEESGIDPVDQPDITEANIEQGQPFTFTARVTVRPEVQLGQYYGVEAAKSVDDVTSEMVEEELKRMQESHSRLETIDEPAANGDTVVIDYDGYVDGEAFAGGAAENYMLELGSNTFIPGYEEQLIGTIAGDKVDVKVTFPEKYQSEELAGKEAIFKVKVHEVKRKVLPELNEDFVLEISEFESVEELKADIKEKMQQNNERQSEVKFRNELLHKIVEASEVEVPAVMANEEVDAMVQEAERNLQNYGISIEQYVNMIGQTMENYRSELYPEAEKRVKTDLILEKIVEVENIELDEEQFEQRIDDLAKAYNQSTDAIKKVFEAQPEAFAQLQAGWKKDRALQLIAEKAVVIEAEQGNNEEELN